MDFDLVIYNFKKNIGFNIYISSKIKEKYKDILILEESYLKQNLVWISYFLSVSLLVIIFYAIRLSGFSLMLDFLKNLITIPLLLVGIVIPVIVLMINVIEKRINSEFLNIYFNTFDPLKVLKVAIISLLICIILYFLGTLNFGLDLSKFLPVSPTPLYGALIVSSIILPLLLTFLVVNRIVKSVLDDKILYEQILTHLNRKIMATIQNLIEVDYFKKEVSKIPNGPIEIDDLFVGYGDAYQPYEADKTGGIVDIDMRELNKLAVFLNDNNLDLIISTLPGRQILSYFKVIAYSIDFDEKKFNKVRDKLNRILIVDEKKNYDDLYNDFKNLHELTLDSLDKNDKNRFQRLIDIYFSCLNFYIINLEKTEINKPQYEDYFSIPLIRAIFSDLDNFISNENNQVELLNIIQNRILFLAKNSIKYNDPMVLRLTVNLFLAVYYNSFLNKIRINSINPIESILFDIVSNLETWPSKINDFDSNYFLLEEVLNSLKGLFVNSVDFKDFNASNRVLNIFLRIRDSYPSNYTQIMIRESVLKTKVKELKSDNEEYHKVVCELERVQNILNLPEKLNETISHHLFEIGAVILKKDVLDHEKYRDCFELLSKNFSNNKQFLEITEKVYSGDYLHFDDSKILFFCMVSLKFLTKIKTLPPLKFIFENFHDIKNVLETIKKDQKNWEWFIDDNIDKKIDVFFSKIEKSTKSYERIEEDKLIAKSLDSDSVELFKRKLNSEINKSPFISGEIPVNDDHTRARKKFSIKLTEMSNKIYFTNELQISNYYRAIIPGLIHGYRLNPEFKDTIILEELIANTKCESSQSNQLNEDLNFCIESMEKSHYSVDLILIPADFEIEFYQMEEFKEDNTENHIFGYYNEIKVVVPLGATLNNEILLIDTKKACEITQIEQLNSDVRIPTDDDKKIIQKRKSIQEREIDLNVVIEISESYAFDILEQNAIMKLCFNSELLN